MIQFPAAPVLGQIFAPLPGVSYKFDGTGWGTNLSGTPTGDITVVGDIQVSGQGLFGDGTLAAPGISWLSDPDSGWRRAGNQDFRFVIDGVDIFSVAPGGITGSMPSKFPDGTDAAPGIAYAASTNTGFSRVTGNINIDIAGVPECIVHTGGIYVQNRVRAVGELYVDGSSTHIGIVECHNGLTVHGGGINFNGNITVNCGPINTSAGTIAGAAGMALRWDGGNANYLCMGFGVGSAWSWQWNRATGYLAWLDTNSSQLFAIGTGGDIYARAAVFADNGNTIGLVGGSNPYIRFTSNNWRLEFEQAVGKLHFLRYDSASLWNVDIGGNVNSTGTVYSGNTTGFSMSYTGVTTLTYMQGNPAWDWIFCQFVHVAGNWAGPKFSLQGTEFQFRNNGQATKPAAGQWDGNSDIRLKSNVRALEYGLAEILKLRPIEFELDGMKLFENQTSTYVGISAQDVEPVMPRMVFRSPDEKLGEVLGVRPDYVQYALVNAVKELAARVIQLEKSA